MNAEPDAPGWASQRLVAVLENVAIARDTYRLRWTIRFWRGPFFRASF